MREYQSVYQSLGIPNEIVSCALGQTPIPIVGWSNPAKWYGFPPALIPIASNGSGPNYFGLWKHWFSDRMLSYVVMYVGSGRLVVEVARNADQFFSHIAMTALGIDEGIESSLEQFATSVGIHNLTELDAISLKTGDNPQGYDAIPQFQSDLPLNSVREGREYTGDFPINDFFDSKQRWANASSFEFPRELSMTWPSQIGKPRWLTSESKEKIFLDLLANGDLNGAWLTLNSTGWTIDKAKLALSELVRMANEPQLTILAEAWSKIADPIVGGY